MNEVVTHACQHEITLACVALSHFSLSNHRILNSAQDEETRCYCCVILARLVSSSWVALIWISGTCTDRAWLDACCAQCLAWPLVQGSRNACILTMPMSPFLWSAGFWSGTTA